MLNLHRVGTVPMFGLHHVCPNGSWDNSLCLEIWSVDISEGVLRLTVNFQSKSPAEMPTLNSGLPMRVIINSTVDIFAVAK